MGEMDRSVVQVAAATLAADWLYTKSFSLKVTHSRYSKVIKN